MKTLIQKPQIGGGGTYAAIGARIWLYCFLGSNSTFSDEYSKALT